MFSIIKLYYQYIFSKKIILVFIVIHLVYIVSILYSSGAMDGYSTIDMYRFENQDVFYHDFVLIVKILSVTFNVFVVSLLFKETCVNMSKYLVDKPIKKLYVIWAKLLLAIMISSMMVCLLFEYYSLINIFCTPYTFESSKMLALFFAVLVQNITYVYITFLFMSIIPSMLTCLLPILLFWYMELNGTIVDINNHSIGYYFYKYIPSISLNMGEYKLSSDVFSYLFFIAILLTLTVIINTNKEIL